MPESLETTLALFEDASDEPVDIVDLDPADARATYTAALAVADMTLGMPETETWPLCRALIEWAFGLLPEGGRAPEWVEVPEEEMDRLVEAFLSSAQAEEIRDDPDAGDIADTLLSLRRQLRGRSVALEPDHGRAGPRPLAVSERGHSQVLCGRIDSGGESARTAPGAPAIYSWENCS